MRQAFRGLAPVTTAAEFELLAGDNTSTLIGFQAITLPEFGTMTPDNFDGKTMIKFYSQLDDFVFTLQPINLPNDDTSWIAIEIVGVFSLGGPDVQKETLDRDGGLLFNYDPNSGGGTRWTFRDPFLLHAKMVSGNTYQINIAR